MGQMWRPLTTDSVHSGTHEKLSYGVSNYIHQSTVLWIAVSLQQYKCNY